MCVRQEHDKQDARLNTNVSYILFINIILPLISICHLSEKKIAEKKNWQ